MKLTLILMTFLMTKTSYAYRVIHEGNYFVLYCKSQHADGLGTYRYPPSYNRYGSEREAFEAGKDCPYGIQSVKREIGDKKVDKKSLN